MSSPIVRRKEAPAVTPCQKFEGHNGWVCGAIHLPGGQRIMTCSSDGSLRVWDLKSGKQIGDDWRDGESEVRTIALSPDGKKVVSGSEDGGVRLWDIDTGKVIGRWMGHTRGVNSVCWSRDGQRVLSGSLDGTARQWDVENGQTILTPIKAGHCLFAVVYSPDMSLFATGGAERPPNYMPITSVRIEDHKSAIKIWNAKTGELVATLEGHTDWVRCLVWTPDGKTLISGSKDCSIRTWNTSTWKQIAQLEGHISFVSIAISPNGRILASAMWDNTARLWNLDDSQPISSPLKHPNYMISVSFSADGKLLATGCADKNAYTWNIYTIVKEAGLDADELLLDQRDKPVLAADATRRPVRPFDLSADATRRPIRQPITVPQRRMHQGFFDDLPDRAHVSARHRLHPRSWGSHVNTFSVQFSSLFRPTHSDAQDTSSRPRPFHWVRNQLSGRQSGEDIELRSRHTAVVDVPYAKGKRRNACARERRMKIIPFKPGNSAASTAFPHNSNTTQHSNGSTQAQSSQAQAAASTSTAPPGANTTSHPGLDATIKNPGRWTRFWLFFCCASPEYTHSHQ